jgi:hypothetical protein
MTNDHNTPCEGVLRNALMNQIGGLYTNPEGIRVPRCGLVLRSLRVVSEARRGQGAGTSTVCSRLSIQRLEGGRWRCRWLRLREWKAQRHNQSRRGKDFTKRDRYGPSLEPGSTGRRILWGARFNLRRQCPCGCRCASRHGNHRGGTPGILPLEAQRLRGPRAHPYRGCLTANSKRLDRSPCSGCTIPCSHCWNPIKLHFLEIAAAFHATKPQSEQDSKNLNLEIVGQLQVSQARRRYWGGLFVVIGK